MTYDRERHRRGSIRLANFDYAAGATYFLTLCTEGREPKLSTIVDGEVTLSAIGRIVEDTLLESPSIRPALMIGPNVVMPNHLHVLVTFNPGDDRSNPRSEELSRARRSFGSFVSGYKATSTRRVNQLVDVDSSRLWQRNYYEHVVRNERAFDRLATCIANNPANWENDAEFVADASRMEASRHTE